MPLPNFFIVGTGKAGTTSLYEYLKQHPDIYMSPVKEPGYFAEEIRAQNIDKQLLGRLAVQSRELAKVLHDGEPTAQFGWLAGEWEDYLRLFRQVGNQKAIGEASAAYLWSQTAARNIQAVIPRARIIMMLRDPTERAFSQYLHQVAVGLTRSNFFEHLEECARDDHSKLSHRYPFLEIGLYYQQVKRFLDLFPREQIRVYWYEEAWREPAELLADVFTFLGVDPAFPVDISRRSLERRRPRSVAAHYFLKQFGVWHPLRALVPDRLRPYLRRAAFQTDKAPRMEARDRAFLVDYYRDDVTRLADLLGRDLSAWQR